MEFHSAFVFSWPVKVLYSIASALDVSLRETTAFEACSESVGCKPK